MKKFLKIAFITSTFMLALMAGVVALMLKGQNSSNKDAVNHQQEELDLMPEKKASIPKENIINLYLDGANKNVVTFQHKNVNSIYNVKDSNDVKVQLDKMKRKTRYTDSNALWAYNPFGTNQLSMYLYFTTLEPITIRYTIAVEDPSIPDFTRTLYNGGSTEEQEYQIIGLVPGMDNYITLNLYNAQGENVKQATYKLSLKNLKVARQNKLATTTGKSDSQISNGLFYVLGSKNTDQKKESAMYLFDNSGQIRGKIPLTGYRADRVEIIDKNLVYNYNDNSFAKVSPLGQVMKTYKMNGFKQHHDFIYDGFGHLLILVSDLSKSSKSINDMVVSLDLKTGKFQKILDFEKLLPGVEKFAKVKKDGKRNWIGLNSITMAGSNDIIVSAGQFSSIIRVNQIYSKSPQVAYLINDSKILDKTKYKNLVMDKSVAKKKETFVSQFGQNTVTYDADAAVSGSQYYIYMLNNNYGNWSANPGFNWNGYYGIGTNKRTAEKSMYYKYLVNEKTNTYQLIDHIDVPYSDTLGSAQDYQGNHILCSGKAGQFGEYDKNGKLIRNFKINSGITIYRTLKNDMKGFWFE